MSCHSKTEATGLLGQHDMAKSQEMSPGSVNHSSFSTWTSPHLCYYGNNPVPLSKRSGSIEVRGQQSSGGYGVNVILRLRFCVIW